MKFAAMLGYGLVATLIIAGLWLVVDRAIKAEAANRQLSSRKDD